MRSGTRLSTLSFSGDNYEFATQSLEQLMQARTTLIIAHRLATVRKVDQILAMDGGRIVASGRHDELVTEHGLYARLVALQFREPAEPLAALLP